jgi:hypothetical protein
MLALAPTVSTTLLFLFLWLPKLLMKSPDNLTVPSTPFTHNHGRCFSQLVVTNLFAPSPMNSGLRANKEHCSYPLQLQQNGCIASRAPTDHVQRNDLCSLAILKNHKLCLQRRANMFHNSHRLALLPPTTGIKGERNSRNMRSGHSGVHIMPITPQGKIMPCTGT